MRTLFGWSFALVAIGVGCGGDDSPIRVDGNTVVDANPHYCGVDNTLGSLSLGSTGNRASGDWFFTPTTGANMGKLEFLFGAKIDGVEHTTTSPAGLSDVLFVEVFKGTSFMVSTAYPFTTDGTADTYTAAAYIFGDVDANFMNLENFYFASGGSLTFQAINEPDGSPIDATVTAIPFQELDDQNLPLAGGCTTMLGGLAMHLRQMHSAMRTTGDPSVLTRDQLLRLHERVAKR